jgi:hypothetical protein
MGLLMVFGPLFVHMGRFRALKAAWMVETGTIGTALIGIGLVVAVLLFEPLKHLQRVYE